MGIQQKLHTKLVQKLMKMMEREGVHELELEDDKAGVKLRLKRGSDAPPAARISATTSSNGPAARSKQYT